MTNGIPWKSVTAVLLIFALSTSLSIANADSTIGIQSGQHESKVATQTVNNKDSSSAKKTFKINLSENMGVADNKPSSGQNQNSPILAKPSAEIQINLSEKVTVALNENDDNMIRVVKQNSEFQTTFDRISGFDRIRAGSKEIASNIAWRFA